MAGHTHLSQEVAAALDRPPYVPPQREIVLPDKPIEAANPGASVPELRPGKPFGKELEQLNRAQALSSSFSPEQAAARDSASRSAGWGSAESVLREGEAAKATLEEEIERLEAKEASVHALGIKIQLHAEKAGILPPRLAGPTGELGGPVERDPSGGYRVQQPAGGGGITLFHGTDIASARSLLGGARLNAAAAAARSSGAPPGFYLATDVGDATFFAHTRQPGGVLEYHLSEAAVRELRSAGARVGSIAPGPKGFPQFQGQEFVVPSGAFGLFNSLRSRGLITVTPHISR